MVDCLLIGLGNPGDAYQGTRHNIGFAALDTIASLYRTSFRTLPRHLHGVQADITLACNTRVKLIKPMTFMNKSGLTVGTACRYYDITPERLFVLYDDLDIQCGDLKIKSGGGDAGHNGIKSIVQSLGNNAFYRLRIGIDRPQYNSADYVLARPTHAQATLLTTMLGTIADNISLLVTDTAKAQQFFHTRV